MRRCDRCAKQNGKCIWVLPVTHLGLFPGLNAVARAWLAWDQHVCDGNEEEAERASSEFQERNASFMARLKAFQQSRKQRIGNESTVTPRKRGGDSGGPGDNDALVAQVHRLVAVGESLVDMSALVCSAPVSWS